MSRIVAITGGAGALGGELARLLAGRGDKVALFDTERGRERATALAKEIDGFVHVSSFRSAEDWAAALAATTVALGGVPTAAALVAGGWAGGAPVHEAKDEEAWTSMMSANADSVYRALHALLPGMVAAKGGSVVVVGSRAATRPWTSGGSAAYAASKAAVVALAQTVAAEVLEHGVRVNAVLPSTMDTPANRAAMPDADATKWVSLASAAGVIAFLLSDDARDVSGAALPVYGRA
ncbi:MAG: SDR family NAD(P)-dependent oxidoreductase [Labilithrix sp.]|nr:SDR family NAD(P)-dependent oxidoreductase [Labilithrix sp.]MCW5818212.1 SDR family NAD(P)-dependent oxidoreductase [Labilithrix sp.]